MLLAIRMTTNIRVLVLAAGVLGAGVLGCGEKAAPEAKTPAARGCREGPVGAAATGVKTAGQAVEMGAETGWAGVKNLGRAAGGLVSEGPEGAEREWKDGKEVTRGEAREGKAEVAAEANLPPCPPR